MGAGPGKRGDYADTIVCVAGCQNLHGSNVCICDHILPWPLLQYTQTKPHLIGYIDSDEWNLNYMMLSLYLLRE